MTFRDEVHDVFTAVVSASPAERSEILAAASPEVRSDVESLLTAHDSAGDFLERPVFSMLESARHRMAGAAIGPYRLVRELGRGGMGTVYLAVREDGEFAQRVAIKVVRRGAAVAERFRQERQILAALEHPNIARLIDGGVTSEGVSYLVMEYVDGTPIHLHARALPLPEKLRLFLQLCDAVQYAHRALIVHRDLKPANVLVTADGVPKLLDFGIAKLITESGDAPATRVMTPQYASPEQLAGLPVTTSSDVYSLGVLLFEILTGRAPFGESRTFADRAEPPSRVRSDRALRNDLDAIVLTALESDLTHRYRSVERLADDVRRHLEGKPVSAHRSTVLYRSTKFVRRHTAVVAIAVIAALAAGAAFTLTLQQKRLAERRFDQVRSLARSVVFDLHDAIAPLPGSTPARAMLVRRALVYLDALAAEARDNGELQRELVEAYLRIGDVQGLPYQANLGDTQGALASYSKARKLIEGLLRAAPDDVAAQTLAADVHDRLGLVQQRMFRWPEAIAAHETARAIRESLPAEPRRDLALARTWTAIGDAHYIGGDTIPPHLRRSPESAYLRALATLGRPQRDASLERDRLVELARAHQRLGGYYSNPGRAATTRAIRHHDAALHALEARVRLDPDDAVMRRNWADQFIMKATAYNLAGDGASALEATESGLSVLEELASQDGMNAEAQHDLAFAHAERGKALRALGRIDEAAAAIERAVVIRRRLVAEDPSNEEAQRDLELAEQNLTDLPR